MMQFEVGDIVSYGGKQGIVIERNPGIMADGTDPNGDRVIWVEFNGVRWRDAMGWSDTASLSFLGDGREYAWQSEPILKLISRPKKKVPHKVSAWALVYKPTGQMSLYQTHAACSAAAVSMKTGDESCIIELCGEYETEEG